MSSSDDAGTAASQYLTSLETFPEFTPTDYFLSGDGTASQDKASATVAASTTYKHDPANPIPTLCGANLPAEIGGSIPCGPHDRQSIDGREDMVVFNVAARDTELVLTGPIIAELFVSSDMIDTDFLVRISDVYNDEAGTVRFLQDNAQRMRWREQIQTLVCMRSM
jgi:predicted acyl esterase